MARYEGLIDPAVIDYVLRTSVREADIPARLRKETADHPKSNFQIPPEQGQLLQILIRMTGARRSQSCSRLTQAGRGRRGQR